MSVSFASPISDNKPVVPRPVLESLSSTKYPDDLAEMRDLARELVHRIHVMGNTYDEIYRAGPQSYDDYVAAFKTTYSQPGHPLAKLSAAEKLDLMVMPDKIAQMVRQIDHTTLNTKGDEDRAFMTRMFNESVSPIPLKAICARPEKMSLILDLFAARPERRIAIVTGFPHSAYNPDNARREIDGVREMIERKNLKNPVDIDTVAHYVAWMNGDHDLVRAIFAAEAQACKDNGFTWKTILESSVHAYASKNTIYGEDAFRSLYEIGEMAMEEGLKAGLERHYLKTCTGQPMVQPYNNFVPADVAYPELTAPMFMAAAQFNAVHGTKVMCKVSGGNLNEKDVVANLYLYQQSNERLGAPDLTDDLVMGAGPHFRDNLLRFLYHMEKIGGPKCGFGPEVFTPYGVDVDALPSHAMGVPPRRKNDAEDETTPQNNIVIYPGLGGGPA